MIISDSSKNNRQISKEYPKPTSQMTHQHSFTIVFRMFSRQQRLPCKTWFPRITEKQRVSPGLLDDDHWYASIDSEDDPKMSHDHQKTTQQFKKYLEDFWRQSKRKSQMTPHTFASLLTRGLAGKSTSFAFRMVLFSKMAAWVWLWPNGWKISTANIIRNVNTPTFSPEMLLFEHRAITSLFPFVQKGTIPTYLLPVKHLKKYHSYWPHINLKMKMTNTILYSGETVKRRTSP